MYWASLKRGGSQRAASPKRGSSGPRPLRNCLAPIAGPPTATAARQTAPHRTAPRRTAPDERHPVERCLTVCRPVARRPVARGSTRAPIGASHWHSTGGRCGALRGRRARSVRDLPATTGCTRGVSRTCGVARAFGVACTADAPYISGVHGGGAYPAPARTRLAHRSTSKITIMGIQYVRWEWGGPAGGRATLTHKMIHYFIN